MLGRLWTYVKRQVVATTPNEVAACLECGVPHCSAERLMNCKQRIAHAAALDAWDREHAPPPPGATTSAGRASSPPGPGSPWS